MGYDIDFLKVQQGSHSGDAIALRLGDLKTDDRDDQFVAIVDGGFTSSGELLVEHVRQHYGTNKVDVVVSTHLDRDHIQGLSVVVAELAVGQLWMHEPTAAQEDEIREAASASSGERKDELQVITASLNDSRDLASQARDLGIEIVHPFEGLSAADGALRVIGPTEDYYDWLVSKFRDFKASQSLRSMIAAGVEEKTGKAPGETLDHETLENGARTGPENNSSVITLIRDGTQSMFLTGDAGEEALERAATYLDETGFEWATVKMMQIPHHGSVKNVTPKVLDKYLGKKVQTERTKHAYVSCSPDGGIHHPAKRVTNAFHRRGCKVFKTAGVSKRFYRNAPDRDGYSPSDEVPFYEEVD